MDGNRKTTVRAAVLLLLILSLALAMLNCRPGPTSVRGAVLEQNTDPHKESPIIDVNVTAVSGSTQATTKTNAEGSFKIDLKRWIRPGEPIRLTFQKPGYRPIVLNDPVGDTLYVVRMVPMVPKVEVPLKQPQMGVSNVKVRYSTKTSAAVSVGSAVKVFEVVNSGNIPCNGQSRCSPDGKWKASLGALDMDAGEGNEFRNVRLSCIAGPCPFTRVESEDFKPGREIHASILGWSDTTTFLVEAEVYHPMSSEVIQESYSVIFGRRLNFSVPETAEGISIEADENGSTVIYPLGPSLCLSWANCTATTDGDYSKTYRCELKPEYTFH